VGPFPDQISLAQSVGIGALKKIQSQGVGRSAPISTLTIFRACGDPVNEIEDPQNGTGNPKDEPVNQPGNVARGKCPMIVQEIAGGVEVLAPAKLNLFLEVLAKRPDGYHEIESLMVTVDLYDTLTVTDCDGGSIELECDDQTLPTGSENLVVKAAEHLKVATGSSRGARITLTKVIPAQAGLGGGSSDAAATLVALDRIWDLKTPANRLHAVAGAIGSDVAFFLRAPSAICRGRGERVEPVVLGSPLYFVLVAPDFGVSTAEVYRNLRPPETPWPIGPVTHALAHGDPAALGRSLFNRLQPVAEAIRPSLGRVRDALAILDPPPCGSLMSGSGSAYFGLCPNLAAAHRAVEVLQPLGLGWVRVVTCGP
jgi:4-diphosphocytidyl-2-C-methyl-D-erythritol kinase